MRRAEHTNVRDARQEVSVDFLEKMFQFLQQTRIEVHVLSQRRDRNPLVLSVEIRADRTIEERGNAVCTE